MKDFTNYFAIVPAAGVGHRMGLDFPKQYISIKGKTILEYTLTTLLNSPKFKKCVVVIHKKDDLWPKLRVRSSHLMTAWGGEERCHSVFNGLLALKNISKKNDWIVIHDAVRPLLHESDIDLLINQLNDHPVGGLLGHPIKNTVKYVDKQQFKTLDRQKIWLAVTPQMFRYHWLVKALALAIKKNKCITDEASAIELIGQQPKLLEGRADNIKITTKEDLNLLDYYLSIRSNPPDHSFNPYLE
ncbi:2-C-methyl-D-erythritol 4-phosphate cytidylyltransferase [Rickettsiella grylli]|uniref:2-C-methyl-D-erythritol 4-phosphate cytidylyltransferase n=1 Tax=Rickettsiella grylli TaxID=59196 RepID=A8PPH8_9COXI|nr:2-C-methyl-D-erythritol 4-phosphate cytidylyltransferase [Rickettsiella grylli]EDP46315.1 2-C-methyl-D-erythritol 4-phosphate cytidylyltransferase [Rickettsiella grylli]